MLVGRICLTLLAMYAVTVAVVANVMAHCTGKGGNDFIVVRCHKATFGGTLVAALLGNNGEQSQESLRYFVHIASKLQHSGTINQK